MIKNENVNNNLLWLWLLFFIYPITAFITALRNINIKKYRIFILMFAIFYGFTFIPIPDSDATRYQYRIQNLGDYSFEEYTSDITNMYDVTSIYNDAYIFTVFFILSKFTSNYLFYKLFFGFVYFFVKYKLIFAVYDAVNKYNVSKLYFIFLFGLLFVDNISSGLNGVRWPLGFELFLLGAFKYITTNKFKYILLSALGFLVHFAIGYAVLFLLIFALTRRFYKPLYALVSLVVFFFFFSAGAFVGSNTALLGEGISKKADSYSTNEEYKEIRNEHLETLNWYVQFDRYSTYYYGLIVLVFLIVLREKIHKDEMALNLEYLAVVMFVASFISGQVVDELSNRYYLLSNAVFLFYMFYLSSINKSLFFKRLTLLYYPIGILHILIMLRGDQPTYSPNLFFGNVITEILFINLDK